MIRALPAIVALVALSGCELLFPEDPRLGTESVKACTARVESDLRLKLEENGFEDSPVWLPTYTYDITKLSLEDIQSLSSSRSDETQGTRLDKATNMTSTAVDAFMQQQVDEEGAFFLGHDPALYRVRGEAIATDAVIAAGCERQLANMRLIDIDLTPMTLAPVEDPDQSPETESE